ncbi:bifunctional riboflavin kinase/FAD synthetase [Bacillus daqingensis]|uniref:Riboflavin biosynthesis protein n=1 Tax=Bacillus daqingensis TaxID=872396 RepID=A0ABV9NRY1_9BACI
MEIIELEHPIQPQKLEASACAFGFFDGVHRGHQQVIQAACKTADEKGLKKAVMTFYPHPKEVLRGEEAEYLTTLEQKVARLRDEGIDYLFLVTFSPEFAALTPQQFVDEYVIGLQIKHVTAGFDYSFGHKGKGTMDTFPFHSRGKVSSETVDAYLEDEQKISSTAVRNCLHEGDVETAALLLGRRYEIRGLIVHGAKRGRTIGFPTANVAIPEKQLAPANGVYSVKAEVDGTIYNGVANIGINPTFTSNGDRTLEVHLFEFDGDIYGKECYVSFLKRIRAEKKFGSAEELKQQIAADAEEARQHMHLTSERNS